MVAANALSSSLTTGDAKTLNGDSIEVVVRRRSVNIMINDANVIDADIIASNGIVHAIDAVLTPPSGEPADPTKRPTRKPVVSNRYTSFFHDFGEIRRQTCRTSSSLLLCK